MPADATAAKRGLVSDVTVVPDPSRVGPLRPTAPLSSETGPITSWTMLPRSTACAGDVSGSVSCDAADGGGHTLSWNIDPDSDARARNRRGGDAGIGEVVRACGGESGLYPYAAAYG